MSHPDTKYFTVVYEQLMKYKMMVLAKLAVTSEEKLLDLIRLAAGEEMPDEDFMKILSWLDGG